jgi:hypothetical protein
VLYVASNLAGFVWPVYCSFKALSSDKSVELRQWLAYWTVYGVLDMGENFLFLYYYVPMYNFLKLGLLIFCMKSHVRCVFVCCVVHLGERERQRERERES